MNRSVRSTTAAVLFALTLPMSSSARQVQGSLTDQIDARFEHLTRSNSPGLAMVVVRNGEVVLRRGYGLANLEHQIPITPSTVFDIASVSKQFTGLAISILVEEGTISLEDDVRDYIPELADFGHTITIDHLVHHTSGIRDWPGTLGVAGWRMDDVISFDQILSFAFNQGDLNFVPGAEYTYSNTGFNLLAEVVARATGQSFRQWTWENLFEPLGMTSTHFHDDHTEVVPSRANGYSRGPGGTWHAVPNGLTALGSSSLYTSVDDLAKWVMNFDDPKAGSPSALERMKTRGVLNDGSRIGYAFGVNIGEYRGLPTVSHGGSWAAFRTALIHFPEQDFGVVVLANHTPFDPTSTAFRIADLYLEDELAPEEEDQASAAAEEDPSEVPVPISALEEYVGVYKLGPAWYVRVTREGDELHVQATAEDRVFMAARSESEFWVRDYGASMIFRRSDAGQVTHLEYRGSVAPKLDDLQRPSLVQLAELTGEYESTELATTYQIILEDGDLFARHRRHGDTPLTHAWKDDFRGGAWFLRSVEFQRDSDGHVVGMLVNAGERNRNIRFRKRR